MLRNKDLFITGFLQVFLVVVQTSFIVYHFIPAIAVVGFLISYCWTYNVRKTVIGTNIDRIIYSGGAAVGAIAGVLSADMINFIVSSIK